MSSNYIGQRLSFDGALCTVRYIGSVEGTAKEWLGVEWDDTSRGKHDGEHKGQRYFKCKSNAKNAASFVRPSRTSDAPVNFVEAVHTKYATETIERRDALAKERDIEISGKLVQEVGFEKIRMQLRQLQDLKVVLVDGMRIHSAQKETKKIKDVCPQIVELDLSRNLLDSFQEIVKICSELEYLRSLALSGNRLRPDGDRVDSSKLFDAFSGIKTLSLDETLLSWEELCLVASYFPSLQSLDVSMNELRMLPSLPALPSLSGLTSVTIEYNHFTELSEICALTILPNLQKLHLKGNRISSIAGDTITVVPFGANLTQVDLSYNNITSWSFIDALPSVFPGLTTLRISHNPVYNPVALPGAMAISNDETYMLTLARLAGLQVLNFSTITTADRTNAEMFYLSRIAKEIATAQTGNDKDIIKQHARYSELCKIYGPPEIVRADDHINPNFLEARLIQFVFYLKHDDEGANGIEKSQEIPKGFDVYQVKGIVGKLFNVKPLKLKLTWETGEWDPVAGEDFEDYEGSENGNGHDEPAPISEMPEGVKGLAAEAGRFMRREMELEDGTRQIGNLIDGMKARVRVELR